MPLPRLRPLAAGNAYIRTSGIVLAATVVVLGVVVMSVKGRIKGDEIDYKTDEDKEKISRFRVVSRALAAQMFILVVAICIAGWLSLGRVWGWK